MVRAPLTVHLCDMREAIAKLEPIFRKHKTDTMGGLGSAEDQLRNCECFCVRNGNNEAVGYYAIQVNRHRAGTEVVIVAAAGILPGADLVATLIPYIEQQAKGAQALTVHTRRRGLLAKLRAQGFGCDGFILRKQLA